ncbi:hypothetical protein [Shewanella sp. HL-SH2]|uniref:hypothetical protein n=1 Tax=Shewanella sp. HL-SH2 TaxID=3436238 RepID=UPI003EBAAACE
MVTEAGGVFEAAALAEQTLTTDTFILVVSTESLSQTALSNLHRQKNPRVFSSYCLVLNTWLPMWQWCNWWWNKKRPLPNT